MPNSNWESDVRSALEEQKQTDGDVFSNPLLAKFCVASGILTALIAVAVGWVSTFDNATPEQRRTFKSFASCVAIAASTQVGIGAVALISQRKRPAGRPTKNEPPAIGW